MTKKNNTKCNENSSTYNKFVHLRLFFKSNKFNLNQILHTRKFNKVKNTRYC